MHDHPASNYVAATEQCAPSYETMRRVMFQSTKSAILALLVVFTQKSAKNSAILSANKSTFLLKVGTLLWN